MNQKSILAVFGIAVIILIITTVYFATINKASQPITPAPKVTEQSVQTTALAVQPAPATTQPTSEIANWQTYSNAKYGYEIKYPVSYFIFQGVDQKKEKTIPADLNSKKIIITDNPRMFFSGEPVYLSVEVLDGYVTNLEKWILDNKIITDENSYRVIKKGYISFAGEQAYQVQAECGIDSPGNIVLVNHNSNTYKIRYDGQDCLPLSEKISSTFDFTK